MKNLTLYLFGFLVIVFFSFQIFPLIVLARYVEPLGFSGFNQNLKQGDRNSNVLVLQRFLNTDPDTIVSNSGFGSEGNETDYFGPLTKDAVIRFQNKYADEILRPIDLDYGTGFVGLKTRAWLNSLRPTQLSLSESANSSSGNIVKTSAETSQTQMRTEEQRKLQDRLIPQVADVSELLIKNVYQENDPAVRLIFLSSHSGSFDETISFYGTGFLPSGNTIHFGEAYMIQDIQSSSPNKIIVNLDKSIPPANYSVWISNKNGQSDKNQFFVITDGFSSPPVIKNILPAEATYKTEMTIIGSGFSKEGNEVRTSFGIIPSVSSFDGQTLRFTIDTPELLTLSQLKNKGKNVTFEMPAWVYVVNKNGISKEQLQFKIKI